MKRSYCVFLIVVGAFLTGCAPASQTVKNPPFTVENVYAVHSNTDEALTEIHLTINKIPEDVAILAVYFQEMRTQLNETKEENHYLARFVEGSAKEDMIIVDEMVEESNNPIPKLPVEPPTSLNNKDMLLVYSESGKQWFYRIKDIKFKAE